MESWVYYIYFIVNFYPTLLKAIVWAETELLPQSYSDGLVMPSGRLEQFPSFQSSPLTTISKWLSYPRLAHMISIKWPNDNYVFVCYYIWKYKLNIFTFNFSILCHWNFWSQEKCEELLSFWCFSVNQTMINVVS